MFSGGIKWKIEMKWVNIKPLTGQNTDPTEQSYSKQCLAVMIWQKSLNNCFWSLYILFSWNNLPLHTNNTLLKTWDIFLDQSSSKLVGYKKVGREYWKVLMTFFTFVLISFHIRSSFCQRQCVKSVQIRSYFWSVFSCIPTEYGDLLRKSPYSVRIQQNADQE